jgi:subtilisin family serine protease
VVEAGVTVAVAAGNQGVKAANRVPGAYKQVLTVSGFADSDGEPGHDGPKTCSGKKDDVFLPYTNFGNAVDIAAAGDCIQSYNRVGGLVLISGTSQASPHVAGAAAHFVADYAASHGGSEPTPDQVRGWLLTTASRTQAEDGVSGDPDTKKKNKKDKKGKKGKKGKHKKKRHKNKKKNKHKKPKKEPVLWLEVLAP